VAELDTYSGALDGISVVEVEFESETQADGFRPPAWFGRELTGDRAWANQTLAAEGRPEKRLEFRMRPGEELAQAICRVITARASQAAAAVRRAGEAEDSARDVHEARKSLKKVRSALRLLRGVIPDDERRTTNTTCGDASASLSGARDAEVKLATLGRVTGDGPELDGGQRWRADLEAEAASRRGNLRPESLAEVAAEIDNVARSFRGRELPPSSEAIAGNVGRGYRRGRKAMKRAGKGDEPENFHVWRKRAKDLRYQLEFLEPGLPDDFRKIRKSAEELADQLGDLHDLDVLAEDLEGRGLDSSDREVLNGQIAAARDQLADSCIELGKKTYSLKPARFTNRIGEALADPGPGPR
jgi:CHAD domain-containing protein